VFLRRGKRSLFLSSYGRRGLEEPEEIPSRANECFPGEKLPGEMGKTEMTNSAGLFVSGEWGEDPPRLSGGRKGGVQMSRPWKTGARRGNLTLVGEVEWT